MIFGGDQHKRALTAEPGSLSPGRSLIFVTTWRPPEEALRPRYRDSTTDVWSPWPLVAWNVHDVGAQPWQRQDVAITGDHDAHDPAVRTLAEEQDRGATVVGGAFGWQNYVGLPTLTALPSSALRGVDDLRGPWWRAQRIRQASNNLSTRMQFGRPRARPRYPTRARNQATPCRDLRGVHVAPPSMTSAPKRCTASSIPARSSPPRLIATQVTPASPKRSASFAARGHRSVVRQCRAGEADIERLGAADLGGEFAARGGNARRRARATSSISAVRETPA